ncbi:uncharacterized protein [Ptychodera flava]|uniref:uncharacterized protein n=1 Tax=Ptychodera flava TaxID=63121 RepID=UPI003969CED4
MEQIVAVKNTIGTKWLRNWNVSLNSESKDREKAKGMTLPLVAEQLPFTFTVKGPDGKLATEVRLAPCVCLEDISSTVLQRLDLLEREGKLTWHGVIPSDEIWLKIGWDKGGGSTKAVFELCNVAHPNSIENTIVWNIFQAPDRRHNIETAYKVNLSQINALCGTNMEEQKLIVFVVGDYEYLTTIFGLSGASGKHFCLWCTVSKEDAQKEPCERPEVTARTLDQLKENHEEYVGAGSKRSTASQYNNVINKALFEIPIHRVAIPALHMSLGLFQRFYDLLETECAKLDLEIFCHLESGEGVDEPVLKPANFDTYLSMLRDATKLESEAREDEVKVQAMEVEIEHLFYDSDSDSDSDDGDKSSLQSLREKSAAKDALLEQARRKTQNINIIIDSMVAATENVVDDDRPLINKAKEIATRFKPLFTLFADCHRIYSVSRQLSDEEIKELGINIAGLLEYYRTVFSGERIFPKLHILECHALSQIQRTKMGLGFLGENGVEVIHHHFNLAMMKYNSMPDELHRLKCMVNDHHIASHPTNRKPKFHKRVRRN